MAEAVQNITTAHIYIPYAIECQGNIVQAVIRFTTNQSRKSARYPYSMMHHRTRMGAGSNARDPSSSRVESSTLEMLDPKFQSLIPCYDAPFQVKANNGIYLIDDFGRQRVTAVEVSIRWIVPMERRVDFLNFGSGGKMTVPFEAFLIFSTNLKPAQLGDEAFLRRIQYKMLVAVRKRMSS